MMKYTAHLVLDEDRTKKACDGEIYIPPDGAQVGDTIVLCENCATLDALRKPSNA